MKNIIVLAILLVLIIIPGCVDSSSANEENAIETLLLDLIDSDDVFGIEAVSYTHLTLPTICSV